MNLRKLIIIIVVALVLFYLITAPTNAASAVDGILNWLKSAAESIITFVKTLFS